jgi:glycerol-3-phosphate dehydrogenase
MAERVVDLIIEKKFEDRKLKACHTESILLAGGKLSSSEEVKKYREQISASTDLFGLKGDDAGYLVHLYGTQATDILEYALKHEESDPEVGLVLAELWFAINHEMVVRGTDFLVRRTGLLYFDLPKLLKVKEPVLNAMSKYFSWSEDKLKRESEALQTLIDQTCGFKA